MKLTLERQIPLVFAIATVLLIVVTLFAVRSINSVNDAVKLEKHTQDVISRLDETLNLAVDAETGARGFLITVDDAILEPYDNAKQSISGNLNELQRLVADNPDQKERVAKLGDLLDQRMNLLEEAITLRRTQSLESVKEIITRKRGIEKMQEIRSLINQLKTEEKALLTKREGELNASLATTYRMLLIAGIGGIASLGLANFAIYREIGKRSRVEEELKESNKGLEQRVEERTAELSKTNQNLVTEGKRREESEQKSNESELFTRAILNSLSAHIAVIDHDGKIVSVNEAWDKFGSENCADETQVSQTGIGQNYIQVCRRSVAFEENTKFVLENLESVLSGDKKEFSFEYPCHSPTEERWFILQVNALQGEKGGAVISHINISDRKKAEVELKNSEEFNRSIFENSPDCVKVLELDGTLHSMNSNGLCIMEIDDIESVHRQKMV